MATGIETAAGVYGLVTGTIAIIQTSIAIYDAVQDKSGVTKELRKVSSQIPSIKELLEEAAAQYTSHTLDEQAWIEAGADVKHCNEACQELQDLLQRAYPKADASSLRRVCKNLGNMVSNKGKAAEELLRDIGRHLERLNQRNIITNTKTLEGIKNAVDELFPQSGITQHNIHGQNIGRDLNQSFHGGVGPQFNASGATYHAASK
jgi:hypothetical protein